MADGALLLQEELDVVTMRWSEGGRHLVGLQVLFHLCYLTCVFIPAVHASKASLMLWSQGLC